MRLANHVKFQFGEIRKFDWCCEILSEAGAPCGSRFQSKRPLRCHQLRSNLHGHGRQTSVFSSVITNHCPRCRSTFSTTLIARKHAASSILSGHCRVDAGAFPWPIFPPESLQCSLCDDETVYTSIDELYDHSVAVISCEFCRELRWRSHFLCRLMPAVLERTTPALENALMVDDAKKRRLTRRKSGGGGRGSATPRKETEAGARGDALSRAGSIKKPAAFCKSTTQLMGIIIKQCLRGTEVSVRDIFDTIVMATEHDVVKSMREQTRRYNEGVQAAGKGHTLGPPQIWAWRKQEAAVGAANEHGHEVRSCEVL